VIAYLLRKKSKVKGFIVDVVACCSENDEPFVAVIKS
jgi:hypothetical protein